MSFVDSVPRPYLLCTVSKTKKTQSVLQEFSGHWHHAVQHVIGL